MSRRPIRAGRLTVAVMLATVSVPVAEAQCATGAREFASIGGMQNQKLRVRTDGWHNSGQEIGRFWSALSSADNNNFAGTCPSNDPTQTFGSWWNDETGNPNCGGMPCYGVRGALAGTGCTATACQDDPMVVLVEDWGPSGPPGIRDTAYFFAARIDLDADGAVSPRRWDYGLVDDVANGPMSQVLVDGSEHPRARLVAFSYGGAETAFVELEISDPGGGVWAAVDTDTDLPDGALLTSVDLCFSRAPDDPGRERELWDDCISFAYPDELPARLQEHYPCPFGEFLFFAAGMTFDGGDGPPVESRLVGRAAGFNCTSLLAEPDLPEPALRRPTIRRDRGPEPSRRR